MRLLRAVFVLVGLVASGVLVDATPAMACSCAAPAGPPADRQHFTEADAVFEGTVVGSRLAEVGPDGFRSSTDPEVVTFAVRRVHKGEVRERQDVVTEESSASCGLEVEVGASYLVFAGEATSTLSPRPETDRYYAGLCGGTRSLAEGPLPRNLAGERSAPGRTEGTTAAGRGATEGDDLPLVPIVAVGSVLAVGLAVGALALRRRHRTA